MSLIPRSPWRRFYDWSNRNWWQILFVLVCANIAQSIALVTLLVDLGKR